MNQNFLLEKLKKKSKELMEGGKYFHDFAHVMGVYKNVERLLECELGDRLVLLTAALFHDVRRDYRNHGSRGSKYVKEILRSIPEFPRDLIDSVALVINAHNKEQKAQDEKLFFDADKMEAFNELAHARSFMMYAKEGLSLREACFNYLDFVDLCYNTLHTTTAKKLVRKEYREAKYFALKLVARYKS